MAVNRASLRGWALDLAIATAGGLFLGLIGPFGSYYNGPLWQNMAFQIACFWAGTLLFGTGIRLLLRFGLRLPALLAAAAAMVVVLTWPFSALVAWMAVRIWPFLARMSALEWYLQGLATALPVVLGLTMLIEKRGRKAVARAELREEAQTAPPSRLGLLGMSPKDVLCLQMEDHYVRVHGAHGSRLVLATLGQAIAALGPMDGLQVHRSWWIARRAVAEVRQEGRNVRLLLTNGVIAPVARTSVVALRAAGWMTP